MYVANEVVAFTAQRPCQLAGQRFRTGDVVHVRLVADWHATDHLGAGGPWGWGGFTSPCLRRVARTIEDAQTGRQVYSR